MPQVRTRIRRPAPVSEALGQIGERIRKARIASGLSQAQLGAPHFTRAYVSAIELGKVRPAMKSLEFLADKLGKATSYFMEDEDADRRRHERAVAITRCNQLIEEGKASEAIPLLLNLVQEGATPADKASLQRSLGRAYTQDHQASKASAVLNDALRFYKTVDDAEQIARTRSQLGEALMEMRTYTEAQQEFETALAFMSKVDVKDPLLKVHTLYNLGVTFFMHGDYRAASLQFDRAAREGADVGDLRWQAGLFAGMGMSYSRLEDFEAAVMYLRKSEALFEAINNRTRAVEVRLRAAESLHKLGQRSKADELFTSALRDAKTLGTQSLAIEIASAQAANWSAEGRTEEGIAAATAAFREAKEIGDPLLVLTAQFHLAAALRKTDPKRAEKTLRDAASAKPVPGVGYGRVYSALSEILSENGMAEEALNYARKAYEAERQKGGS
jgi:tetratricopeptide (TPR) repeat protein